MGLKTFEHQNTSGLPNSVHFSQVYYSLISSTVVAYSTVILANITKRFSRTVLQEKHAWSFATCCSPCRKYDFRCFIFGSGVHHMWTVASFVVLDAPHHNIYTSKPSKSRYIICTLMVATLWSSPTSKATAKLINNFDAEFIILCKVCAFGDRRLLYPTSKFYLFYKIDTPSS